MRSIIKRFWAAIAGWNTISTRHYLDSFCAAHDPVFEEYVDLPDCLSGSVTLPEAEDAIKKAERELWDHLTNDHGGPWDKQRPFLGCYSPRKHSHIKEELQFWIRNLNRLKDGLPPVTNPLWLRNQTSNATIRFERKLVPASPSRYGVRLALLVSSNVQSCLQDIESSVSFPINGEEGVLMFSSITLKKGKDIQIIQPDSELEKEVETWFKKEIFLYPLSGMTLGTQEE
jgi:hypothetical protein